MKGKLVSGSFLSIFVAFFCVFLEINNKHVIIMIDERNKP